jgi:hypothetical protein
MAPVKKAPVFKETARYYLKQLAALSLPSVAGRLGLGFQDGALAIEVLGATYRLEPDRLVAPDGSRASFETLVVVSRYLLSAPPAAPADDAWAAYREFPDAAPLVNYFRRNAEEPIANAFAGRVGELQTRLRQIGGRPAGSGLSYDLAFGIRALSHIPIFLLFNDADDEFPAECRLLFERRAAAYLDMESLAILAAMLAAILTA